MTPTIMVVPPDNFASTAATVIEEQLRDAVMARGTATLALSGGSTPAAVYAALATRQIDWAPVQFFFGDERAVPPDHPDSNYAMAQRTLFGPAGISHGQIHRMQAEQTDLDAAATEYAAALPEVLDTLLLGLGPDGHTASLFPGSPALAERVRRVVAVNSPEPPLVPQWRRMTVTPPCIIAARNIVMIIRGGDKADVLHRVLDGPDAPLALPAQIARRGLWILDTAAAAHLTTRNH